MNEEQHWILDAVLPSAGLVTDCDARRTLVNNDPRLEGFFEHLYGAAQYLVAVESPATGPDGGRAVGIIMTQATNDYVELVRACETGNGRSAARAARSLLEHAVNLADVAADPELGQRYLDHLSHGEAHWGELSLVSKHLVGKERKTEVHRRRKAQRDGHKALQTHLVKYGSGFSRQWNETNLRARLQQIGWPDEYYSYYRLTSAILHGAAYGSSGLVKEITHDRVHRLGPAWQQCPDALLYGLQFMERLLDVYALRVHNSDPVRHFLEVCKGARDAWPAYRAAALQADRDLWPGTPPIGAYAVVGLAQNGLRRWYVVSPHNDRYAPCQEPADLTTDEKCLIDDFQAELESRGFPSVSEFENDSGLVRLTRPSGLVTLSIHHRTVRPVAGAHWRPTDGLFGPRLRSDYWMERLSGRLRVRHRNDGLSVTDS